MCRFSFFRPCAEQTPEQILAVPTVPFACCDSFAFILAAAGRQVNLQSRLPVNLRLQSLQNDEAELLMRPARKKGAHVLLFLIRFLAEPGPKRFALFWSRLFFARHVRYNIRNRRRFRYV